MRDCRIPRPTGSEVIPFFLWRRRGYGVGCRATADDMDCGHDCHPFVLRNHVDACLRKGQAWQFDFLPCSYGGVGFAHYLGMAWGFAELLWGDATMNCSKGLFVHERKLFAADTTTPITIDDRVVWEVNPLPPVIVANRANRVIVAVGINKTCPTERVVFPLVRLCLERLVFAQQYGVIVFGFGQLGVKAVHFFGVLGLVVPMDDQSQYRVKKQRYGSYDFESCDFAPPVGICFVVTALYHGRGIFEGGK